MDFFGSWLLPVIVVAMLVGGTLIFALFIGRWIDAQSNSVVDEPREPRKKGQA